MAGFSLRLTFFFPADNELIKAAAENGFTLNYISSNRTSQTGAMLFTLPNTWQVVCYLRKKWQVKEKQIPLSKVKRKWSFLQENGYSNPLWDVMEREISRTKIGQRYRIVLTKDWMVLT